MKNNIDVSTLPLTFQEAIAVARRLGFCYIWIDSLCIVQDSAEDWRSEASTMGDVYSHGYCNIAATKSHNGAGGLFSKRDPSQVILNIVNSGWEDRPNETYDILEEKFWESRVSTAPLNRRAWVIQERFLAPRVLHFGKDQLMWECREMEACEAFPHGLRDSFEQYGAHFKGNSPSLHGKGMQQEIGNQRSNVYCLSESLLEAYTQCQLTKEEDKFVAFSGIAKYMQQSVEDTYVAGLWRSFLSSQLLWQVRDQQQENGRPSCRSSRYRAPSWSWASVDGSVSLGGFRNEDSLIEVLECAVEPTGTDLTAGVKNVYLRLRGALHHVTLMADSMTRDPVECSASMKSKELETVVDLDSPPKTEHLDTLFLPVFRRMWY